VTNKPNEITAERLVVRFTAHCNLTFISLQNYNNLLLTFN